MTSHSDQRFTTRWGLLLSVLGIAVGTGNIWRFPRIAATNAGDDGAGAFLVAWLFFLLAWSIPLIIAEYALGRKGRMGLIGTFSKITGEKFAWMGAFIGFVATAIMFYYSVVAGWCVFYLTQMVGGNIPDTQVEAMAIWDQFQAGGQPVFFHALAMVFGALAVWRGIQSIERVNKVLIPTLLVIVVIALVRAVTLDGAGEGIRFLFTPSWDTLSNPQIWLEALTQNAWDTGAGWGLILTYGAYMERKHGIVKNAIMTGVGNNLVSMMAAITIFAIAFAVLGGSEMGMSNQEVLAQMQQSGPAATGLTFVWMPLIFSKIAAGGSFFAILFFLGLSFAAFSSLISMIELTTRLFVDGGLSREKAIFAVCTVGFLMGIPSAINLTFFENQDFVWGVALMISGGFVAFAVLRFGVSHFRREVVNATPSDWSVGKGWDVAIKFMVPLQAIVLLGWWLYRSATEYAPETWFDPTDPFSVMTCLVQWGGAILVFTLLNRWMVSRLRSNVLSRG